MGYNNQMKVSPLIKYLSFQIYTAMLLAPVISKKSDPEILHKFRVSIRRTRSLIALYMPEQYAFLDVLRQMIQQTNALRELDVLSQEKELTHYPHLQREVIKQRKRVFMEGTSTKRLLHISDILNRLYDDILGTKNDIDAAQLIATAETSYSSNMNCYRTINKKTTENQLHQLRIGFKITRYALEFLTESGLKDEKNKINRCKDRQESLGDVQDTVTQILWIKQICKENHSNECKPCIRSLKARLKELRKNERHRS